MCLSTVYRQNGDSRDLVCEYVIGVRVLDGIVKMRDIEDNEVAVAGSVRSIDLVRNTIVIDEQTAPFPSL